MGVGAWIDVEHLDGFVDLQLTIALARGAQLISRITHLHTRTLPHVRTI